MKKVLIGITGLALLVFVAVLTVSAKSQNEDKNAGVVETVEATACGASSACMGIAESTGAGCSMAAEASKECDHEKCIDCTCEDGKCDGTCSDKCEESCEECAATCENSGSMGCDMGSCKK